jgi:hypothetical protein
MVHVLKRGLFYRCFPGTVVFLDLPGDRYFQLSGERARYFASFVAGDADANAIEWLCDRDIIEVDGSPPRTLQRQAREPLTDYQQLPGINPPARLVTEAIIGLHFARRAVRHTPFQRIIENVAGRRGQANGRIRSNGRANALVIAAAFASLKRFCDTTDMCLPLSISMITVLRRRGHDPSLVLGVSLPFAAHCWVQQDEMVLSDRLDRVRCFSPILVI